MTVEIVDEVEKNIPVTNEETVTVEISIEGHSNLVLHAVPYNGTGCSTVNDIGLIIISWILLILKCSSLKENCSNNRHFDICKRICFGCYSEFRKNHSLSKIQLGLV